MVITGAIGVPVARMRSARAAGDACVQTPRPDPALPVFFAQEQAFGFHDEELVLCSPGASGGTPTHLAARLWVPQGCPPAGGCPGVLVVHGFGATKETSFADMRDLATRGMYVLAYDVRGQGLSGGQADMMGPDTIADEAYVLGWFHDTVGPTKVGVYGISQGGAHALMAAEYNCGPARAAALDSTIPCDQGGVRWVDAIAPMQAPANLANVNDGSCMEFWISASAESRAQPDIARDATRCEFDGTPPDPVVEAVGDSISDDGLARDNDLRNLVARADRIDVPVYLATSYFDRLVPATDTTDIYEILRARAANPNDPYVGTDVRLIISNDAHGDIGANFAVLNDVFTWLASQLSATPTSIRDAPVASAQEWAANAFRLESSWPIAGTTSEALYLGLDTSGAPHLRGAAPPDSTGAVANVPVVSTSPWVPVPGVVVPLHTVGLLPGDSLRYESDAVGQLTEITGVPELHLWLSTPDGSPYGQVTVALDEVTGDGKTATQFARIRRGFADLSATATEKTIPLTTTSWRLDPGNFLRMTITATDIFEATPALANHGIVIHHGLSTPSRLVVPTVDPNRPLPPGDAPTGSSFTDDPIGTICTALNLPCPP
jgi:ABC-2 type transport system ATP-binding protein